MFPPIWHHFQVLQECPCPHHLQVLQECPCPPKIQEEDRWSLDMVSDVRSWLNFHRHSWWMFHPIWYHIQVHQECPCPPRLQEETWRTCGVLTWFLMSDFDETVTNTSDGYSIPSDTIYRSIRNVHILLESRMRLGGHVLQDKTSSQTISLIVQSSCYITKQGLTQLKSRLVKCFFSKF